MKFILSIHPFIQLAAILLACYAAYLGIQRASSLHFGQQRPFRRQRHVIAGALALVTLLGGFFGGFIIASRFIHDSTGMILHETVAFIILPFLVIGIASGYYLYIKPEKRQILPAVHGVNNLIILLLVLFQIYSGWHLFRKFVLGG